MKSGGWTTVAKQRQVNRSQLIAVGLFAPNLMLATVGLVLNWKLRLKITRGSGRSVMSAIKAVGPSAPNNLIVGDFVLGFRSLDGCPDTDKNKGKCLLSQPMQKGCWAFLCPQLYVGDCLF